MGLLPKRAPMLTCLVLAAGCMTGGSADDDADVAAEFDAEPEFVDPCPTAADPTTLELRVRHFDISAPAALAHPIWREIVNNAFDEETTWLLSFTGIGTGSATLRFGTGTRVYPAECTHRFVEEAFPSGELPISESDLAFTATADVIPHVDLALWLDWSAYPDPPDLLLPLGEVRLSGSFGDDRLFIGSYDEVAWDWVTGGQVVAKIAVREAQEVSAEVWGHELSLCGILSGDAGSSTDETPMDDCLTDPATWPYPPDTTIGAEPAWEFAASFAASAVWIEDD